MKQILFFSLVTLLLASCGNYKNIRFSKAKQTHVEQKTTENNISDASEITVSQPISSVVEEQTNMEDGPILSRAIEQDSKPSKRPSFERIVTKNQSFEKISVKSISANHDVEPIEKKPVNTLRVLGVIFLIVTLLLIALMFAGFFGSLDAIIIAILVALIFFILTLVFFILSSAI